MTQKCLRMLFVSVAFLVLMPLPALTQTPFAPPPQIPFYVAAVVKPLFPFFLPSLLFLKVVSFSTK